MTNGVNALYTVDTCPHIKDHFFLCSRNLGPSRMLKGNVTVIVCFMKQQQFDFLECTKAGFLRELATACEWLTAQARRHGTNLNISYQQYTIDIPPGVNPQDGFHLIKHVLGDAPRTMDDLQSQFEKKLGVDETPFMLVFDKEDRSFARHQCLPDRPSNEVSVIFKSVPLLYKWTTVAHELLHQFGAFDFYYPPAITEAATQYFKDSIMGIGKRDVLDDLTAYLVGIKDTFSRDTRCFLEKTMWMTYDHYVKAVADSWQSTKANTQDT